MVDRGGEGASPITTQLIPAAWAPWSKNREEGGFAGQSPEEIEAPWGKARGALAPRPYSAALPAPQPTRVQLKSVDSPARELRMGPYPLDAGA